MLREALLFSRARQDSLSGCRDALGAIGAAGVHATAEVILLVAAARRVVLAVLDGHALGAIVALRWRRRHGVRGVHLGACGDIRLEIHAARAIVERGPIRDLDVTAVSPLPTPAVLHHHEAGSIVRGERIANCEHPVVDEILRVTARGEYAIIIRLEVRRGGVDADRDRCSRDGGNHRRRRHGHLLAPTQCEHTDSFLLPIAPRVQVLVRVILFGVETAIVTHPVHGNVHVSAVAPFIGKGRTIADLLLTIPVEANVIPTSEGSVGDRSGSLNGASHAERPTRATLALIFYVRDRVDLDAVALVVTAPIPCRTFVLSTPGVEHLRCHGPLLTAAETTATGHLVTAEIRKEVEGGMVSDLAGVESRVLLVHV
mmetsp:Transcript_7101/g.18407  ORF Transcript_7101/g.18407 Transcript_7101/m.18407 type:complete len:371 (-) Transcript_7101:200-1312(-)